MSYPEETIEYSYFKVILSTRYETEWAVHLKVPNDRPGHYSISDFYSALKLVLKDDYRKNTVEDAIDIFLEEYDLAWLGEKA